MFYPYPGMQVNPPLRGIHRLVMAPRNADHRRLSNVRGAAMTARPLFPKRTRVARAIA
jgi:hypothetical protein